MRKDKKCSPDMEDYLEAILVLKEKNKVARVRDISQLMSVKPPSVASALHTLSRDNFVIHESYGYVDLTPEGGKLARRIQKRHEMLTKFLTEILCINPKIAAEDACRMEHAISQKTSKKLTKFLEFVQTCPDSDRPDWLKSFDHYFKTGKRLKCKIRVLKQKDST